MEVIEIIQLVFIFLVANFLFVVISVGIGNNPYAKLLQQEATTQDKVIQRALACIFAIPIGIPFTIGYWLWLFIKWLISLYIAFRKLPPV